MKLDVNFQTVADTLIQSRQNTYLRSFKKINKNL